MQDMEKSSSSYIMNLYYDIEELTNNLPYYYLILDTMHKKYGANNLDQMQDAEKESTLKTMQLFHIYATRTYIKFNSLCGQVKEFQEKAPELEILYEKIRESQFPDYKDAKAYVLFVNKLFASGVINEFLKTAQQYFDQWRSNTNA